MRIRIPKTTLEVTPPKVVPEKKRVEMSKKEEKRERRKETPCRPLDKYRGLEFLERGSYGEVYRAKDQYGNPVALKNIIVRSNERYGFPPAALREIDIMLELNHPNVVKTHEVIAGSAKNEFYLVMEFGGIDLHRLTSTHRIRYDQAEIKSIMIMLLKGIAYLHDEMIMHRDIKPANLLINSDGILKVCDFGLARSFGDADPDYSPGVVTLWYRAPEVLMGSRKYSSGVDMWAVGCIFAELLLGEALFQSKTELQQLYAIFSLLGRPGVHNWKNFDSLPHVRQFNFSAFANESSLQNRIGYLLHSGKMTEAALLLLEGMLRYDPEERFSAREALAHPYFSEMPKPREHHLIRNARFHKH